ncbi:TetR/AcrR family transcriptional regulator C-terminal domain-containing protein [Streptomyces coffeae]|uniref:TetR/AcrR family transcriptional regulator C-terminal domain-containing protein n=1 Tax=Streptomyces coffeae TaxID=621382 RepID=A0ABS1NR59_9ACTN|nr:TetR/AcrR family transcriptional regulator C-terminal domain-containing protein [Streptomyces coffeae]MBL1102589.1 TetR/AcrR family transcriptional regulator C-terminal domain-containing protein [Streptomyces coffeae]
MGENRSRRARADRSGPGLSRADVVEAALRFVDVHGLEALSMRTLAKEMGVYPNALHWHVGTKSELVAAVAARVLEDIVLPPQRDMPWDAWVAEVARLCRRAMHQHPNLSPVIGSQLGVTASSLPFVERMVDVLERAGFSAEDLIHAYNTVTGFILGWVTLELSSGPATEDEDWKKGFAKQLRSVNPNVYPALTRNMKLLENNAFMTRWDSGCERPMDLSFEAALEVQILGLRAKLT